MLQKGGLRRRTWEAYVCFAYRSFVRRFNVGARSSFFVRPIKPD